MKLDHDALIAPPGKKIRLKDYDPGYTGPFTSKKDAAQKLEDDIEELAKYQDILYAHNIHALLLVFQAMDAAGKDGTIKHVMSGVNPQGCQVFSFKAPSSEELDHDYLWRSMKCLPERGRIGIFNRSYYEEVLVTRVHESILAKQQLPDSAKGKHIWKDRYRQINDFERYLVENGIMIVKFYLNVSKKEQKERFLERIRNPDKNWKFSATDVKERSHWDDYMDAYENCFSETSTKWAPWYIIPADNKWFTRAAVSDVIISKIKSLDLHYPKPAPDHQQRLEEAEKQLMSEND